MPVGCKHGSIQKAEQRRKRAEQLQNTQSPQWKIFGKVQEEQQRCDGGRQQSRSDEVAQRPDTSSFLTLWQNEQTPVVCTQQAASLLTSHSQYRRFQFWCACVSVPMLRTANQGNIIVKRHVQLRGPVNDKPSKKAQSSLNQQQQQHGHLSVGTRCRLPAQSPDEMPDLVRLSSNIIWLCSITLELFCLQGQQCG